MKLIEKFLAIIFQIWNKFSMLFKFLDSIKKILSPQNHPHVNSSSPGEKHQLLGRLVSDTLG